MTDEPFGSCTVCARRDADRGSVCPACRSRLSGWLGELPGLYADLLERDDVLRRGGAGGRVSGTHEAPVPVRVDALDLTMPARGGSVVDVWHDQIGHLPAAAVLDAWVQEWRTHRGRGEGRPVPAVAVLCRWLRDRLDDACDSFPAMGDFADELHGLRRALFGQLGLFDVPEYKDGVRCRSCDALDLWRNSGSAYVECNSCGLLLSPAEYADWIGLLAAHVKGRAA